MVRSHDKPIHSQPGLYIQTYKNIILRGRQEGLQRKYGVFNENLAVSNENIGVSNETSRGSPIKGGLQLLRGSCHFSIAPLYRFVEGFWLPFVCSIQMNVGAFHSKPV